MHIAIVGTGYLGLVAGACRAIVAEWSELRRPDVDRMKALVRAYDSIGRH